MSGCKGKGGRPRKDPAVGTVFGRLTVLRKAESKHKLSRSVCLCSCGNEVTVYNFSLRDGDTKSCGCLLRDKHLVHGGCTRGNRSRLFNIWSGMKDRCENPNSKIFRYYGGKGVAVCDEWHRFEVFRDWAMANGYRDDLSIDRIDVNGSYCRENCRWVTKKDQCRNRSSNVLIEINGEKRSLMEWCELFGFPYKTAYDRYHRGKVGMDLFAPIAKGKNKGFCVNKTRKES